MNLVNQTDFCALIGASYNNLATYHLRRKFVYAETNDGLRWIDTEEPINAAFITERRENIARKAAGFTKPPRQERPAKDPPQPKTAKPPKEKPVPPPIPVKPAPKPPVQASPLAVEKEKLTVAKFEVGQKLAEVELERKTVDLRIAKLKEQKLAGEVIPVALVEPVVFQCLQHIHTHQQMADEALLAEIAQACGMSAEDFARFKGIAIRKRNTAITDAKNVLIKDLKNIVADFTETRGVGEHD